MSNLTFEIQRSQFIGLGINWHRRDMFDYGWISLQLPFVSFTVEWTEDYEAYLQEYYGKEALR